ncbi:MAG: hypothetical protein WBW04_09830 [Nitrolancea sp.]
MPDKTDATIDGDTAKRPDATKPFDPRAHLRSIRVRGREVEYLDIKWRLVWLRSEHRDAHVITQLVSNENNIAVFRAEVVLESGGRASGYGSESKADFGDYIEKAETKAIGRALAALGYGTQFALDFDVSNDEVEEDMTPATRPVATEAVRASETTRVRVVAPPELDIDDEPQLIEPPTNLRPIREEVQTEEPEAFDAADYSWTEFWKWARSLGYTSRSALGELLGRELDEMTPHEVRQRLIEYRQSHGIDE